MENMSEYKIKTEVFEGPLDLLLSLIEKRKLFINDIALAKVADDYIGYVKQCDQLPVKDTAQFILVASTLVLIKSKSLLPSLQLNMEEQESIDDLEERLKVYQRVKLLSARIQEKFGGRMMFQRMPSRDQQPIFSPDDTTTISGIVDAVQCVLQSLPKYEQMTRTVVQHVVSLEEVITALTERITSNLQMSFDNFLGEGKKEKVQVVVSFLAMLELVKQGMITVRQETQFEDIHMESREIGTPRYNEIPV